MGGSTKILKTAENSRNQISKASISSEACKQPETTLPFPNMRGSSKHTTEKQKRVEISDSDLPTFRNRINIENMTSYSIHIFF